MDKIRALRAEEIECRVGQISAKGCSLLLYKDSRCDKRILDEIFGITGWQDFYTEIKGNLFCTISIWDSDKKQWINKQDCGTESNAEKEKGEASDAFKRACFNIGIGRELYTKIFIWINAETVPDGNKYKLKNPYEKWHVSEMEVDNNSEKIIKLIICDSKDIQVFTFNNGKSTATKPNPNKMLDAEIDKLRQDIQEKTVELCENNLENMQKCFQAWCQVDDVVHVPEDKLKSVLNTVTKLLDKKKS